MIRLGSQDVIRALRVAAATAVLTMPLALASTAAAETCPVRDLTCTVSQVSDEGQGAGGDAVHSAGDAAGGAQDTAQGAVDDAQHAVDQTVGTLHNAVDDALGNGAHGPLDGGGNGGENHGGGGGNRNEHGGSSPGSPGSHPHPGAAPTSGGGNSATPLGDPGLSTDPGTQVDQQLEDGPTIGQVATGVIHGAAVMALLLAAVAVFLGVQNRLDRRDPKLAPAAIGSDQVPFT